MFSICQRAIGKSHFTWSQVLKLTPMLPLFNYVYNIISFSTLRPRQNGRHFADDTFKRISMNENVRISINISSKLVPKGLINNIPAMVQIMAWRQPGDKSLSQPMMVSLPTHICVARPQWVNERWHETLLNLYNVEPIRSTLVTYCNLALRILDWLVVFTYKGLFWTVRYIVRQFKTVISEVVCIHDSEARIQYGYMCPSRDITTGTNIRVKWVINQIVEWRMYASLN